MMNWLIILPLKWATSQNSLIALTYCQLHTVKDAKYYNTRALNVKQLNGIQPSVPCIIIYMCDISEWDRHSGKLLTHRVGGSTPRTSWRLSAFVESLIDLSSAGWSTYQLSSPTGRVGFPWVSQQCGGLSLNKSSWTMLRNSEAYCQVSGPNRNITLAFFVMLLENANEGGISLT